MQISSPMDSPRGLQSPPNTALTDDNLWAYRNEPVPGALERAHAHKFADTFHSEQSEYRLASAEQNSQNPGSLIFEILPFLNSKPDVSPFRKELLETTRQAREGLNDLTIDLTEHLRKLEKAKRPLIEEQAKVLQETSRLYEQAKQDKSEFYFTMDLLEETQQRHADFAIEHLPSVARSAAALGLTSVPVMLLNRNSEYFCTNGYETWNRLGVPQTDSSNRSGGDGDAKDGKDDWKRDCLEYTLAPHERRVFEAIEAMGLKADIDPNSYLTASWNN